MRPKRLPGAQVGERDVPSADNWLPYIPIHLLQSQSKVPRVRYTAAEKELKNSRKRKEERKREMKLGAVKGATIGRAFAVTT